MSVKIELQRPQEKSPFVFGDSPKVGGIGFEFRVLRFAFGDLELSCEKQYE